VITAFDISEICADLAGEPLASGVEIYRRAEEVTKEFVNEAYAANVAAETILPLRVLSWHDLPTAAQSLWRYPADLVRAQMYGWIAWLDCIEKQHALLREHVCAKKCAAAQDRPQAVKRIALRGSVADDKPVSLPRTLRRGSAGGTARPAAC
jgi:hypothetical protein